MKVLLISYYFFPCSAIGAQRWSILSNELRNKGIHVTILSGNWVGEKLPDVEYLGEEINYTPPQSIVKNSLVDKIKHPSEFLRSLSFDVFQKKSWIDTCESWFRKNKAKKYDFIIASFSPVTSVISGHKAKKYWPNARLIIDFRDLISMQGQKIKLPIVHQIDCLIDKLLTRKMEAFITIGDTTFKKAVNFYNKPGLLCYNGIQSEPSYQYSDIKTDIINISYFGTLSRFRTPWKLAEILDCFAVDQNMNLQLRIYSKDNPGRSELSKKYNRLKIQYYGFVKGKELLKAREETNIFLVLENPNPDGNENITGKVFEYLSFNKPILAHCNKDSDIRIILKMTGVGQIVTNISEMEAFFQKFIFQKITPSKTGFVKLAANNRADDVIKFLESLDK